MARNVDLTGKLGIGEKPTITIGDAVLTVNDSATNVLQILAKIEDGMGAKEVKEVSDMLFDKQGKKDLERLDLSFTALSEVVSTAIDLVMGRAEGEAETQATTS